MKLDERSGRMLVFLMAVVFAGFTLTGCSGGGGSSSDGGGGGSPEITLSTGQLAFGNVVANAAGLRSADRSVEVTNTGTANLVIGQINHAQLAAPFSIFEDNCSGVSVAPNGSCKVIVRFAPTQAPVDPFTGSFDIPSNDANEASLTVNVSGNGKGLNVTINKVDSTSVSGTILMIVSVTDGNNNAVDGLLHDDFAVTEQGDIPASGFSVFPVGSAVSTALDLDWSISITDAKVLDDVKASAKAFLRKLTNPSDEAAIVKFARVVQTAKDFTTVPDNLGDFDIAIDADYGESTTATKLYDAVFQSVDKLSLRGNDRLAVLVVSDFIDRDSLTETFASVNTLDDVIDHAKEKKVFIFTIGLGSDIDTVVMQQMAVGTDGQYFEAPDSADLDGIYNQISAILTNQYEIRFDTTRPAGSSNTLKVVATKSGTPPLTGEDTESVIY